MKKKYALLILLAVYLITCGVRVYWLAQKNGFIVDEPLSVTLACYNDYMWTQNYELDRMYTGKEVKEISLCDNDSLKNVLGDIKRLRKDNRDPPHTNLYYSLLRLALAGLKTGDPRTIIFRGGLLNIISFTVSFWFLYALLGLLFPGGAAENLAALFCAFMSTAAVSNTLLLRDYQIQETMLIVFCYFLVKSFSWKKYVQLDGSLYVNGNCFLTLSFTAAFTLLAGYYAILFVGLSGLYILYNNLSVKDRRGEIAPYIAVLFFGIIIATAFYPDYPLGFISGRATETAQTLFSDFGGNFRASFLTAAALLKTHYFTWPVIALCLAALVCAKLAKKKIAVEKHAAFIFLAAAAYVFIIIYIAPYKQPRYIISVFPFFSFLPLALVRAVDNRKIRFGISVALCVCFLYGGVTGRAVEYVFKTKPETYLFRKDTGTPVFVMNRSWWKYAELVPYFADDQEYCFTDSFENDITEKYGAMYLVMETSESFPVALDNFETGAEFNVGYFMCRKLIRKSALPGPEFR